MCVRDRIDRVVRSTHTYTSRRELKSVSICGVRSRQTTSEVASREAGVQNCVSIYYPATILSLFLSSLARGFSLSLSLRRSATASRSALLPPSPTSYRRYVGCATSLPGNRYLAWLYTEWSSLYRCSPYTNFLRPLLLLVASAAATAAAVSSLSNAVSYASK